MKKLNKLLSVFLTVSILLTTVMTISGAPYVAPELPEKGIIFRDTFDYEANDSGTLSTLMKDGGWENAYNVFPDKSDEAHGKVIYGTPSTAATGIYYSNNKAGYGIEHINTGVLRLSASYMLPSGYEMPPFNEMDYGYYFDTSAKNDALDKNHPEYATLRKHYHYTIEIGSKQTSSPKIVFSKTVRDLGKPNSWNEEPVESLEMEFDKWYDVDVVINYNDKSVKYYVNGEYVTQVDVDKSRFETHFPVYSTGIYKVGNKGDDTEQRLYIDNFNIEKLGEEIGAKVSDYGEDYVDVKFSYPVSAEEIVEIDACLKNSGTDDEILSSYAEKLENGDARIYFDETLEQGVGYELVFENEISPVWGGDVVIPSGYSAFFTTSVQTQTTELLNLDFEDSYDLSGAINNGDIQLFDGADGLTYTLNNEENTLNHLSLKTDDYNTYLEFKHNSAYHQQDNVQFNFLDGAEVTKGILVTEFDYARSYDDPMYDVTGTKLAGWDAICGPTRGYLGYVDKSVTTFTENDGSVTVNIPSSEASVNRNATYITKFIHGCADWNGGNYGWGLFRGDPNRLGCANPEAWVDYKVITNANDNFVHIKIETDLDNKIYKVYIDGIMCGQADFIPGGVNDVIYSAFAMSASRYDKWVTDGSRFLIDNIESYNIVSSPYVTNITLTDYNENESAFSGTVPAGTKKMTIEFSANLPNDAYNAVSVSGGDVTDIYSDGKYITIEFDNCLKANEGYTLTIDDSFGLDKAFVVNFRADEGEIIYKNPTFEVNGSYMTDELGNINVGDNVYVSAEVINTSGETAECIMTLAVYKEGYMTSVYGTELTLLSENDYKDYAVIEVIADEKLKEAEAVKVFIINNASKANPIVKPLVLD